MRAVFQLRFKPDILIRHGQHTPRDGQNLAQTLDRLVKARQDLAQRGEEEVAEALPRERPLREAVVHEPLHERLGVRQRLETAAHIARRQHAEVMAQHARAAAVVRHGHNGRQILRIELQPAQQRGEPRAAADHRHARPLLGRDAIQIRFHRRSSQREMSRWFSVT